MVGGFVAYATHRHGIVGRIDGPGGWSGGDSRAGVGDVQIASVIAILRSAPHFGIVAVVVVVNVMVDT